MLELRNLYYTVNGEGEAGDETRNIIDGLNFKFERGKMYAITGPNGSGKTTTAKMIMGINQASSGNIVFNGRDITDLSISERAMLGIRYGFQNPARFKGITFRDLLAISAGTDDDAKLIKLLSRVGICTTDFLDKMVDSKLSGGEIKKIELATIIAGNPQLAIYDEPDTGIDLWTIGPMVELIKREQTEFGTTTIVVSHNKAFLEAADEVVLIKDGKMAFHGVFNQALPLLDDLSYCEFKNTCEGEGYAECYR